MIERAIRASIHELQRDSGPTMTDQEALDRAIQASISVAGQHPVEGTEPKDEDTKYQALLEKSIQDSLASYQLHRRARGLRDDVTKDDQEVVPPLEPRETTAETVNSDDDEDVQLAIRKSKEEHEKSSAEEEIVLQYVKKQSLAEEAFRLRKLNHQGDQNQGLQDKGKLPNTANMTESAADEEALKLAIEESLKAQGDGEPSGSGETFTQA